MTHLRKLMLEEIERRNFTESTMTRLPAALTILPVTFTVRPTNSARTTSANTWPICSATGSSSQHCQPTPRRFAILLREDAEASPGAWTKRLTRRRECVCPSF